MILTILQSTYPGPNWGLGLIESLFYPLIFYLVARIINSILPKENQISKKVNNRSALVVCLILIGIMIGIRMPFEIFGFYYVVFNNINIIQFHFAIMVTLFYPLHKIFVKKFKDAAKSEEENTTITPQYRKVYLLVIIAMWVHAGVYLFASFTGVNMEYPNLIDLGLLWAFAAIFFAIFITLTVNRLISNEKRISKEPLSKAMYISAAIGYVAWYIQLMVVELFLYRFANIYLYSQDIRVMFLTIGVIYVVLLYISLKYKFLPEATEKSEKLIEEAFRLVEQHEEEVPEGGIGENVILDVRELTTYFYTEEGVVRAVEGVSFKIFEGETLGLVGETGCGKSVTALSILRVVRPPGKTEKGNVIFRGEDLLLKTDKEMLEYRGKDITMIFQDPLNSINPVFKVGDQISEVYLLHMENELLVEAAKREDGSIYSVSREWSENLLKELNIPWPHVVFDRYPHELSGGMRQRIQIAMGIACSPKLLIADEPTTALDVTVQNQILKQMKDLKAKFNTSTLFITHDLGVISKMCDRVAVMYSGFIVEYGKIEKLFSTPYHPYTRGLISSVPVVGKKRATLDIIPGMVPNLIYPPSGCRFHPRCEYCFEPCDSNIPKSIEVESNYFVACHLYDPEHKELAEISIKKAEKQEN